MGNDRRGAAEASTRGQAGHIAGPHNAQVLETILREAASRHDAWIALAVLSLITIATPLALGLRADALAFAGFVVTTALVCLAFWFVVELQSPFHGLIHASPQPLRDALADA